MLPPPALWGAERMPVAGGGPRAARLARAHCSCSLLPCGLRSTLRGRRVTRWPPRCGRPRNAPGQRRIARSSAARLPLPPARCRVGSTLCKADESLCDSRASHSVNGASSTVRSTGGESHRDRPAPPLRRGRCIVPVRRQIARSSAACIRLWPTTRVWAALCATRTASHTATAPLMPRC